MQQNSQPFSSGLLLCKSGNMESLGHRKGHGVNYFSSHGVVIIRMLRISQEICLVIKEFEETFKSMKLSLLVPVRTLETERTALLGPILMSCLPDRRGVCLRWCLWEQQRIALCPGPFSSNKCSSVVGSDWNPQYSCFHCTGAIKHRLPWLLLASAAFPMEFKTSSTKAFQRCGCSSFYQCWLAKDMGFVPILSLWEILWSAVIICLDGSIKEL